MSSPEDFFGSSEFAEDGRAFSGESADLMAQLWDEETAARRGLYTQVHTQLYRIKTSLADDDKNNWQSFHTVPSPEGTTSIWIAHKLGLGRFDDMTHIVSCWDGDNELRYAEYVVAARSERSGSVQAAAHKTSSDEVWTDETIGPSALIQLQNGTDVMLFRGAQNRQPVASNFDSTFSEPVERLQTSERMKKELTGLIKLLGGLSAGTYEPHARGHFE
jgi:hypothetical protein